MATAFADLPLALFTTCASIGAGAFIMLALAFQTSLLNAECLHRVDKMAWIPFAVVVLGFVASAFHTASPQHTMYALQGVGASPLSNEMLTGGIFLIIALVYQIMASAGKLKMLTRKVWSIVVAAAALVFALFMGLAYSVATIESWNTFMVPVQMIGFALVGGAALGLFVLGLAHASKTELNPACAKYAKVLVLVGAILVFVGVVVQLVSVTGMDNAVASGATLVNAQLPCAIVGLVCIVLSVIETLRTLGTGKMIRDAGIATALALVGVFALRFGFYALELSVGLTL